VEVDMTQTAQEYCYDLTFILECVNAFSASMGVGCAILDAEGEILHESGFGPGSCNICEFAGMGKLRCHELYYYGVPEKCSFGDKHISFCPIGLYFYSSPIVNQAGGAKIAAGPFLMEDMEDNIVHDLQCKMSLKDTEVNKVAKLISKIPNITPSKVNALSGMLSLTASFIRGNSPATRSLAPETVAGDVTQDPASNYLYRHCEVMQLPEYPVKLEKRLLASIADSDKPKAQKLLNQLLGHILFSSGGDFDRIKSETYELLVLISRSAIDVGVPASKVLGINRRFWCEAQSAGDIDELCLLLSGVINSYIDSIFSLTHKRSLEDIDKAVRYMWMNYSSKITLEDVAKAVFLSPTYFCKVFQKNKRCSFNTYLNKIRIEKSKELLLQYDLRIADIVSMVGFEDQSYFTKVFKRFAGVSPTHFRKCCEENTVPA
jgi:AraC-like DNA-binding protein/ligand-binding sensor protein